MRRILVQNIAVSYLLVVSAFASASDHWAFQPIKRPAQPNTIDDFLAQSHARLKLKRQPSADPALLLRRLHLDLTGLSPTQKDVQQFLESPTKQSYEAKVAKLLASPHHGERWGRHWMDVWRYSDWYGLGKQLRVSQKHLWRWRDWIINSLNTDKGYDRMIREMLAGDELAPTNLEAVTGTGFLARNYYLFNRTSWLDNTIEHTSKAFLGITMNCVKCHDHKYDPITHEAYYRFRAIFEPHQIRLDAIPGESDFDKDGLPRAFDDHPDAATYVHLKGDAQSPDKTRKIQPGAPFDFADVPFEVSPIRLPKDAFAPGTRDFVQAATLQAGKTRVATAKKVLAKSKQAVRAFKNPPKRIAKSATVATKDDFQSANTKLWHPLGKDWEFRNGDLVRHTANRSDHLRSRFQHPQDFEAIFEYTTTGGTTHKSIGMRFDRSEDGRDYNQVYTSANTPRSKLQISYGRNGKSSYPTAGNRKRNISVGQRYEMRVLVRDRLVNVFLNHEFQLAFQLPSRPNHRYLELTSFEATSAFHSLEIRELADDQILTQSGKPAPPSAPKTLPELKQAVTWAQLDLARHELNLKALVARITADDAKVSNDTRSTKLARAAATAEWNAKQTENEYLLKLEQARKTPDPKKVSTYKSAVAAAKKELKSKSTKYTSLSGSRKALETPAHKFGQYDEIYSRTSTGRRLALANWITHPKNPLTARVAVNHIWLRHFGTPLVDQVFDFGLRAKKPLHLDLLNWLAAELIDNDWSMKHIHRLIVTSDTWQRSSTTLNADAHTLKQDPDNRYYWRMNNRRMESQVVRDNLLHLSDKLDRKIGGVSLSVKAESRRRSIYFRHGRDDSQKFLSMFDDADFLQCYRRSESIVPQQALALSNSKTSLEAAATIAGQLTKKTDSKFIEAAFHKLLMRKPDHYEIAECESFLRQIEKLKDSEPRTRLVHALLNHNDFVTIR